MGSQERKQIYELPNSVIFTKLNKTTETAPSTEVSSVTFYIL